MEKVHNHIVIFNLLEIALRSRTGRVELCWGCFKSFHWITIIQHRWCVSMLCLALLWIYMQTIFWRFDLPELCTESCGLLVLDTNDLAPNYFYDVFIKAYKCKIKRGSFLMGRCSGLMMGIYLWQFIYVQKQVENLVSVKTTPFWKAVSVS